MQLILTFPIRIPLVLNKDSIRTNNKEWCQFLKTIKSHMKKKHEISIDIGNYAILPEKKILYGNNSNRDIGYFAQKHYLFKVCGKSNVTLQEQKSLDTDWEFFIHDNSVAVFMVKLNISNEYFFSLTDEKLIAKFYTRTNKIAENLCKENQPVIEKVIQSMTYITNHYGIDFVRINVNETIYFYNEIYSEYIVPWVNRSFVINQKNDFWRTETFYTIISKTLSNDIAQEFNLKNESSFGWGGNILLENKEIDINLTIYILMIAQYCYFSLDLIDCLIPIFTSRTKTESNTTNNLLLNMNAKYDIQNTLIELSSLITRIPTEHRRALDILYKKWNFQQLERSIKKKLDLYNVTIKETSDLIDKKINSIIQQILFAIGLLSLISLITNVHWYLSPNNKSFLFESVRQFFNFLQKDITLFTSIALVTVISIMYLLKRRR